MARYIQNRGFTLIELILYVGITATIILAISSFHYIMVTSRVKNQTISEVESQAMLVLQIVTQTIRNGEGINSPSPGANSSSLSVNTIAAADDPTVFDVSGGVFQIKEGSSPVVVLTNNKITVSNLTFSNYSRVGTNDTIRIEFDVAHINTQGRQELEYSTNYVGSATIRDD